MLQRTKHLLLQNKDKTQVYASLFNGSVSWVEETELKYSMAQSELIVEWPLKLLSYSS